MSTKTSKLDRLDSELFNREFHDHFFRCTIAFAQNNLDLQRLADTLTKICSFFPYLNSILNEQTGGRVWKERDTLDGLILTFSSYETFYRSYLNAGDVFHTPAIRFYVHEKILGVVINSYFMDGFAVKHLLAIIFDEYNHLDQPEYVSQFLQSEDRSFDKFLATIPKNFLNLNFFERAKLKTFKITAIKNILWKNNAEIAIANPIIKDYKAGYNQHRLSFNQITDFRNAKDFMNHEIIPNDVVAKLKKIMQKENLNISDVLTSAYIRAIAKHFKLSDTVINVGRIYNARIVSKNPSYRSFSNLNVTIPNFSNVKNNSHFYDTIVDVQKQNKKIKNDHIIEKQIALPASVSLGIEFFQIADYGELNLKFFNIANHPIAYMFFTPPINRSPFFSIACVEYNNEIYISSANYCMDEDIGQIKNILAEIIIEINSFIHAMEMQGEKLYKDINNQVRAYYYSTSEKIFDPKELDFEKIEKIVGVNDETITQNDNNQNISSPNNQPNNQTTTNQNDDRNTNSIASSLSMNDLKLVQPYYPPINNASINKQQLAPPIPQVPAIKKNNAVKTIEDLDFIGENFDLGHSENFHLQKKTKIEIKPRYIDIDATNNNIKQETSIQQNNSQTNNLKPTSNIETSDPNFAANVLTDSIVQESSYQTANNNQPSTNKPLNDESIELQPDVIPNLKPLDEVKYENAIVEDLDEEITNTVHIDKDMVKTAAPPPTIQFATNNIDNNPSSSTTKSVENNEDKNNAITNENVEDLIDKIIRDNPDIETESAWQNDNYTTASDFQPNGNYNQYGWNNMQIALAIKYEELTGNIVQPTPNDIYSVQYKIKNKKTYQKRSWIDLLKYIHYKIGKQIK